MSFENKTTQKLISALLIILTLIPTVLIFVPKQVTAQGLPVTAFCPTATNPQAVCASEGTSFWHKILTGMVVGTSATTATNTTKEIVTEALKEIVRVAAQRLLAQMTQSTVNWINTGFHGAPLFVENPGSFFADIGKTELRDFVNIVGYDSVNQPFGKSFALNAINSYRSTFANNAQYSFSKVTNDPVLLNHLRTNFSTGGWDAFLINSQFPQNNYLGSQMIYTDELARRLSGTNPTQTDIIKQTLAQGQGFLSPQKCLTNPDYNNLNNQFHKPTFKCSPPTEDCSNDPTGNCVSREIIRCKREESTWDATNFCPNNPADGTPGLVNTTPGSVVASSIMKAVNVPIDKATLAGTVGNSLTDGLSAIFDALLNKLVSSGLNAITNPTHNTNSANNSTNNVAGTGFDWTGAGQTVALGTFKTDVQTAINSANQELKLIDNTDTNTPGILQIFNQIWPKTGELDMCLPGPNIGWENRVDTDIQNSNANPTTIAPVITSFKTWVTNKMRAELPDSKNFLSTVNSIAEVNKQATDLNNRESTIINTLTKLQSIQDELSGITTQPDAGSGSDTALTNLKQRYDGMLVDLSSPITVADMRNKLADAKDNLTNLGTLITQCTTERTAKGWANPGGADSVFNNSSTEKNVFCNSYPSVPVSCDAVFQTSAEDYKK
ncbi:MAG: hypothetical protein KGL67_00500 [Patescibacteria group bacterium]|nr:hypothetical protein [Patescibacteria group bacterium]